MRASVPALRMLRVHGPADRCCQLVAAHTAGTLAFGRIGCTCRLTAGVLTSGLLPAVQRAMDELLIRDGPILIPSSLTIWAAPVALPLPSPGGLDLTAGLQRHRCSSHSLPVAKAPRP